MPPPSETLWGTAQWLACRGTVGHTVTTSGSAGLSVTAASSSKTEALVNSRASPADGASRRSVRTSIEQSCVAIQLAPING